MDQNSRLVLNQMVQQNKVEDVTPLIRELKHSEILRKDINKLILLKAKYRANMEDEEFKRETYEECSFLFTYYTDIFNKIKKDEIDLFILFKFLDVLQEIELGKIDQHEGAFQVGTLLKELYVDSALKKADKMDALDVEKKVTTTTKPTMNLSYKEFVKIQKNKK